MKIGRGERLQQAHRLLRHSSFHAAFRWALESHFPFSTVLLFPCLIGIAFGSGSHHFAFFCRVQRRWPHNLSMCSPLCPLACEASFRASLFAWCGQRVTAQIDSFYSVFARSTDIRRQGTAAWIVKSLCGTARPSSCPVVDEGIVPHLGRPESCGWMLVIVAPSLGCKQIFCIHRRYSTGCKSFDFAGVGRHLGSRSVFFFVGHGAPFSYLKSPSPYTIKLCNPS